MIFVVQTVKRKILQFLSISYPCFKSTIHQSQFLCLTFRNLKIMHAKSVVSLHNCIASISYSQPLPSYYDILGVSQNATKEDIKVAYIEMCKIYHPDKFLQDFRSSTAKDFLQVREAFDVLSNDQRRYEYDMKVFGRSSDVNRFATGEYKLHQSKAEKHRTETTSKNGNSRSMDGSKADENTPEHKRLLGLLARQLGWLYTAIFITGVAFYFLGSRYRKPNRDEIPPKS